MENEPSGKIILTLDESLSELSRSISAGHIPLLREQLEKCIMPEEAFRNRRILSKVEDWIRILKDPERPGTEPEPVEDIIKFLEEKFPVNK